MGVKRTYPTRNVMWGARGASARGTKAPSCLGQYGKCVAYHLTKSVAITCDIAAGRPRVISWEHMSDISSIEISRWILWVTTNNAPSTWMVAQVAIRLSSIPIMLLLPLGNSTASALLTEAIDAGSVVCARYLTDNYETRGTACYTCTAAKQESSEMHDLIFSRFRILEGCVAHLIECGNLPAVKLVQRHKENFSWTAAALTAIENSKMDIFRWCVESGKTHLTTGDLTGALQNATELTDEERQEVVRRW